MIRFFLCLLIRRQQSSTLFPYTTLFRSKPSPTQSQDEKNETIKQRYEQIFALYDEGRSIEVISKKIGIPKGEVQLIRSEEHTSELQSRGHLVCRLLLEKKKNKENRERTR